MSKIFSRPQTASPVRAESAGPLSVKKPHPAAPLIRGKWSGGMCGEFIISIGIPIANSFSD